MTDDIDRIRAQWVDDLRRTITANKHAKVMTASPLQLACLIKALDETAAERDRHANAYIELHGQHVTKMLELADARSALKRAEAERDAAVARAMPEPRLMRTVEEVEALPEGRYFVHNENQHTVVLDRFLAFDGRPIWLQLGGEGCWRDPEWIVGRPIAGPLPDLPTPTAAQEG